MRLLVIDVGNTSTAIGLWINGRVSCVAHVDGEQKAAEDAATRLVMRAARPDGIAYVSVVPQRDASWKRFATRHALTLHALTHRAFAGEVPQKGRAALGLRLDYPKPETIGADRLADAIGAVARYGSPVLVMDFGTALTAAIVTADGVWRGGVIAPGFPLMRDYLFERTAKLPRMKLGSGKAPKVGRSTEEAMRFGAIVGYRGMVREIVTELTRNFNTPFRLVATGGFAKWALRDLDLPFTLDPTLTLYGAGLAVSKMI